MEAEILGKTKKREIINSTSKKEWKQQVTDFYTRRDENGIYYN